MGLGVMLAKTLSHVKWFGRGPGESYLDKKSSQPSGIWEVDDVARLQILCDTPQENGNKLAS